MTSSDGVMTRTKGAGWNCAAVSEAAMAEDEKEVRGIMASAKSSDFNVIFGLNSNPKTHHYNDIDFGIYTVKGGLVHIYEKGRAVKGSVGKYIGGDTFAILIDNGEVKYFQNGRLL